MIARVDDVAGLAHTSIVPVGDERCTLSREEKQVAAGEPLRECGAKHLVAAEDEGVAQQLHAARPGHRESVLPGGLRSPCGEQVVAEDSKPADDLDGFAARLAGLGIVLGKRDVKRPVVRVLDAPVQTHERELLVRREQLRRNAGGEVANLLGVEFVADESLLPHAPELLEVGEFYLGRVLHGDGVQLADELLAVALLDRARLQPTWAVAEHLLGEGVQVVLIPLQPEPFDGTKTISRS